MDIKKLDKVFSEYIRRRDADEYGRVKCCTCPDTFHWAEMDAGHYRGRGNMATRFNEQNVHCQCKGCNRHKDGMYHKHQDYIIERYGVKTVGVLYALSHKEKKWMQFEIDEMVQEYKLKIKNL